MPIDLPPPVSNIEALAMPSKRDQCVVEIHKFSKINSVSLKGRSGFSVTDRWGRVVYQNFLNQGGSETQIICWKNSSGLLNIRIALLGDD